MTIPLILPSFVFPSSTSSYSFSLFLHQMDKPKEEGIRELPKLGIVRTRENKPFQFPIVASNVELKKKKKIPPEKTSLQIPMTICRCAVSEPSSGGASRAMGVTYDGEQTLHLEASSRGAEGPVDTADHTV